MPGTHTPGGSAGLTLIMTFGRATVAAAMMFALWASIETPNAHAQDTKAKAARGKAAPAKQEEGEDGGDAAKAAPKKRDPAEAQRQIDNGIKLLQAGKAEQAIQTISAAIAGGNLPAPVMAKALYQRGIAYRRTQKPAQAISDFTSALWLKNGLPEQERADALEQRNAAYREAGLPDQATASARPQGGTAAAAAATSGAGSTDAPAAKSQPIARAATAVVGAPAQPTGRAAPQQPTVATSWTSTTEVKPRPGAQVAAAPAAAAGNQAGATATASTAARGAARPAHAAAAAGQGGFGARVALVRTKPEADAVVARLKREFASALEAREPEVSEVSFGNMGAFFQVRVAPFQSQEAAQAACGRLRGPGLDCVAVTR
ncbi:MAG: tetratricopeptide repeat protein [Hyphomicrobiales bacterium]|nr:tetratricopeptide repeat protein [Hyphomicrobiales bacterium]